MLHFFYNTDVRPNEVPDLFPICTLLIISLSSVGQVREIDLSLDSLMF